MHKDSNTILRSIDREYKQEISYKFANKACEYGK